MEFSPFCRDGCFIRGFVLHCRTSAWRGDFNIENPAEGRANLVSRVTTNVVFSSHNVRRNVDLVCSFVPDEEKTAEEGTILKVDGNGIKHLKADPRSILTLFRRALGVPAMDSRRQRKRARNLPEGVEVDAKEMKSVVGISRGDGFGMAGALSQCQQAILMKSKADTKPPLVVLTEDGVDFQTLLEGMHKERPTEPLFPHGVVFVFGDNEGLNTTDAQDVDAYCKETKTTLIRASLGQGSLMASQCVTIVHYLLDRYHTCKTA